MPRGVTAALERVIAKYGQMSEEEAQKYLEKMEKEGRWMQECWS